MWGGGAGILSSLLVRMAELGGRPEVEGKGGEDALYHHGRAKAQGVQVESTVEGTRFCPYVRISAEQQYFLDQEERQFEGGVPGEYLSIVAVDSVRGCQGRRGVQEGLFPSSWGANLEWNVFLL